VLGTGLFVPGPPQKPRHFSRIALPFDPFHLPNAIEAKPKPPEDP